MGQLIGSQRRNDTEMNGAYHRDLDLPGQFANTVGFFDDASRRIDDFSTCGRERYAFQAAIKQGGTQIILQLFDLG